jgi:Ser/Thr protein kinase RdoA (MazF antagonist)
VSEHPYATLTPDAVLDALESAGLRCDGRQLALNSYENRVYQVGIEDNKPVVAKFYRPGRWSDDEIFEEHAFVAELAAAEVPAVPALVLNGTTLNTRGGFRFAVFPRQGGRPPEIDAPGVREWLGRFIGRIHAIGATKPFRARPALTKVSHGDTPRDYLLEHDFVPPDLLPAWASVVRTSSTSTTPAWGRPSRTCGCCSPANAKTWCASSARSSTATSSSWISTRARCIWSRRCARCA